MRRTFFLAPLALLCGCALTQNVPVSTTPSGAAVYLDGKLVCSSTPCSVTASTDGTHLLTILKDGYRQKDIPLRQEPADSGMGSKLSPDIVTTRLYKPGQVDVRDAGDMMDRAVNMGVGVLKHVLEDAGKDSGQ